MLVLVLVLVLVHDVDVQGAEMLSSLGFTSPPNKMAKKDGSEDSIGVFVIISVKTLITNLYIKGENGI